MTTAQDHGNSGTGPLTSDGRRLALVTGAPRSGTTALVDVLNTHPDIAIMGERYNKLVSKRSLTLDHFSDARLRSFDEGDGSPVSFGMPQMQNALAKLDSAKVVGDKVPRPRDMFALAQTLGKPPVLAILREPHGMARSYDGRVARAQWQIAEGKSATWPVHRDHNAAIRDFNDYITLLKDMSLSTSGGTPDFLLVDYTLLFSRDYPVARIFEFLDVDPSRAVDVDAVLNAQSAQQRALDKLNHTVSLTADMAGYRKVSGLQDPSDDLAPKRPDQSKGKGIFGWRRR
ncbi:sulfotransferase [Mameliella sp.]|uniref:sulfotransferase n=1 Tax=Mameliella sp. TaxID=1924940 RepID=UPI003BA8898C